MASGLNIKQKEFVRFGNGPLIAIAGPGTGKTHCLIEKIKFNKDKKILALTFTNKAAAEIKDRLGEQKGVKVHTFHSFSLETLQKQIDFKIISDYEKLLIAQKLKDKFSLTKTPKQIIHEISKLKNRSPRYARDDTTSSLRGATVTKQSVLNDYNKYLQQHNYLDYDDLIDRTLNLNKKSIPKFDLILVDEFQDTNPKQFDLLNHIADNDNITVIGDPNQSIYSFRGANSQIFEVFKNKFPDHKQIVFEINYRSSEKLVSLANKIYPKFSLKTNIKEDGELIIIKTPTRLSEAKFIFNNIDQRVGGVDILKASDYSNSSADCHFKDFAIIYRKHSDSKFIRKVLDEEGIPLQQIGEESPFNSLKVQQMLTEMSKLKTDSKPQVVYQKVVKKLNFEIPEIVDLCDRFADKNLDDLLTYIYKISDLGYWDYLGDKVTLCTIHSAKGLEFKNVFIPQFNFANFPQKSVEEAEELRLFYVVVTRAKEGLFLLQQGRKSRYEKYVSNLAEKIIDNKGYKSLDRLKVKKLKEAQTKLF